MGVLEGQGGSTWGTGWVYLRDRVDLLGVQDGCI